MKKIHLPSTIPFVLLHLACLATLWCGVSRVALAVALCTYWLRVFGLTGGYHRYFSHRSFQAGRGFQFVLAWLGCSAMQLGPLWWAAHHRHHHAHADTEEDVHSPGVQGLWWAHLGWFFEPSASQTRLERVKDLARYPELLWIDRHWLVPPAVLVLGLAHLGKALGPAWGTSAWQMVTWGFVVSTVVLYHVTFCVNSLAHVWGTRRYPTSDDSRNNLFLALITGGEGWHNNHHRYPGSERQGFFWWEVDPTHYALVALSWVGLVSQLRPPPPQAYEEASLARAVLRRP